MFIVAEFFSPVDAETGRAAVFRATGGHQIIGRVFLIGVNQSLAVFWSNSSNSDTFALIKEALIQSGADWVSDHYV